MNIRYKVYAIIIFAYVIFGLNKGWHDIWPWGAVILGVPMILAELGTWYSLRKRNK